MLKKKGNVEVTQLDGFHLLEKLFNETIQQEPFKSYSKPELYNKLDIVWAIIEKEYFRINAENKKDMQQSWNNNNGYFYEKVILDYLNSELKGKGIEVYNMGKRDYYKMPPDLWDEIKDSLRASITRKCVNQRYHLKLQVELDLLAIDTSSHGIITSLTCKTRFRERVYQPLYASRHLINIRTAFITMDRDVNLKTCEKPSEKRALLETFMDAVFVNSSNDKLGFCSMIHPFSDIVPTLLEWKRINGLEKDQQHVALRKAQGTH